MTHPATLGLLTVLALGVPTVASASPKPPVAAHGAPAPTTSRAPRAPQPAAPADLSSYAQREQQDKQVAKYEGGSEVVIGISGGALLVVLVLVLLLA